MKVIRDRSVRLESSVVTMGTFDGVHKGHRYLISSAVKRAHEMGIPSVVITFDVLPKVFFQGSKEPYKLMTEDEKIRSISQLGVDYLYILTFDMSIAQLTAEEFMEQYLVGQLGVKILFMGYNHRFGKGQYEMSYYDDMCATHGVECVRMGEWIEDGEVVCSSSAARTAVMEGDVERVMRILGKRYEIEGRVVHGDAIGRDIGFPTANVDISDKDKIVPSDGVYEAQVMVDGKQYVAAVFIGSRLTLERTERRIETHIIGFTNEIYGNLIVISFVSKIRDVKQFRSLNELQQQIKRDVAKLKK